MNFCPLAEFQELLFFPGSFFTDFHVLVHVTMDLNVRSLDFTSTGASKHPDLSGYFLKKQYETGDDKYCTSTIPKDKYGGLKTKIEVQSTPSSSIDALMDQGIPGIPTPRPAIARCS